MSDAVDLFGGIGWGFACRDLGIHEHGIDIEPTVFKTREALGWESTCADILDLDPADWAGVDGLIASPPCQSWSRAGKGLGLDDPRGQLVWQPLAWALAIRPRWIACEQVPEARGAFEQIAHRLREQGYHADVYELSAETFGVPQTRRRVFLVANRDRMPKRPTQTHQRYRKGRPRVEPVDMLGLLPWVSMAEALGSIAPTIETNQNSELGGGRTERYHRSTDAPSPTLTSMSRLFTLRYRRGAGMVKRYGDRPGRTLDEPSFCLTTGPATGGAKHQWHARCAGTCDNLNNCWTADVKGELCEQDLPPVALTEAQGCRLMGFPDGTDRYLAGNKQDRWRLIGNAVCPPVGKAVLTEATA